LELLRKVKELLRKIKKEKVEANCSGFSVEFFGSQLVEMFFFCQENKNSNVDNFFLELQKNLKSLEL
jgi:hypothetical protein